MDFQHLHDPLHIVNLAIKFFWSRAGTTIENVEEAISNVAKLVRIYLPNDQSHYSTPHRLMELESAFDRCRRDSEDVKDAKFHKFKRVSRQLLDFYFESGTENTYVVSTRCRPIANRSPRADRTAPFRGFGYFRCTLVIFRTPAIRLSMPTYGTLSTSLLAC